MKLTRKRKHQSLRSNAKLGLLLDDDSDGDRLDNLKIQLYSEDNQADQDGNQVSMNADETPENQSSRLTGTALSQSVTPKSDMLMKGDGSIVIGWYGKTNLLGDRDALITGFGTDSPSIYSTEPVKEVVGLSARSVIEDFSARCILDIFVAVLRLDYVGTSDTIDLTLVCTEVCK